MTVLNSSVLFNQPEDYLELTKDAAQGCTVRNLVSLIESYSNIYRISLEESKLYDNYLIKDKVNTYKGDFLEVFAEIFFTAFQSDPKLGLTDYTPISITYDYGVDATAINPNGDRVAVQVKYRANPLDRVTYEDLAKSYTAGNLMFKVPASTPNTLYLFTTANEVSYQAETVLERILVLINRKVIADRIDNNFTFWEFAVNIIEET